MKISDLESAYEAARMWALHPVSHPPPGWAQIVRLGSVAWMRERPQMEACQRQESLLKRPDYAPLLTLVAAMIAEVCS